MAYLKGPKEEEEECKLWAARMVEVDVTVAVIMYTAMRITL